MSNLDDFFSKKDKKKGKGKKFTTANTDTLAKNLEKQELKEAKAEEIKVPLATSEANKAQAALASKTEIAEEEWKDYDEEKKDYSNLKIEALKVEDENEDGQDEEEHEINEDGEKVPKREGAGPWNKGKEDGCMRGWDPIEQKWIVNANCLTANATASAKSEEDQDIEDLRRREKERAKKELESSIGAPQGSVVGGSYVPPHMRGGGGGSSASRESSGSGGNLAPMRGGPKRSKHVPDMASEINFPSLGGETAGGAPTSGRHERDFEEVRGSGSSQHHSSRNNDAPRLALGNKFAALRN